MKLIPSSRGGMLWRFLLGGVIVIAFAASATAVAGLLQIKQFTDYLNLTPPLKSNQIEIANPGKPQTLLLIGSDHRYGQPGKAANTDTMMLVRLDPNSQTINLLSVPRDLRVQIPTAGGIITARLNEAYSLGGPNLLIKILKQEVFPGLRVNHIIDVTFGDFEAMVNAIGCVYTDVDHRYYNNTAYTDYSSIDIQPGYQRLCGSDALAFVRFRHTDNDLVRNARQQDFLRWAKSQYGESQLIANRNRLIRVFGANTQTDHNLHTTDGLINLFTLVAFSASHSVKQIAFPATFLPCGAGAPVAGALATGGTPCYVTASRSALSRTFRAFLTPTVAKQSTAKPHPNPHPAPAKQPSAKAAGLIADSADGRQQASLVHPGGLPVYYPRLILAGSNYCIDSPSTPCTLGPIENSYPRSYVIRDQHHHYRPAYRMTILINPLLGKYYGIQGTAWQNPPILNKPTRTQMVGGKQLMEFFDGHKINLVAWRTSQGAYWVSNTLTNDLTNTQIIEVAASLTRAS